MLEKMMVPGEVWYFPSSCDIPTAVVLSVKTSLVVVDCSSLSKLNVCDTIGYNGIPKTKF